jgi:transposase, IS5 family
MKTNNFPFRSERDFFDAMVPADHAFRKLNKIVNFRKLSKPLRHLYSPIGEPGIDVEKGIRCLIVQYWEDFSDRQMEAAVRENNAVRYFTGFKLTDHTPDHSYFGKLRQRLGTEKIADLFKQINVILEAHGLFGKTFSFLDASAIITKNQLWQERDKAIREGAETLNNANVKDYASDSEARWGQKSANNIWFGHRLHECVDMRFGLIAKLRVTPGNVLDHQVVASILPESGMAFCDKLYDTNKVHQILKAHRIADAVILKNNRLNKNHKLDHWRSSIRMPFEGVFSKRSKRARYRGVARVTSQAFLEAIAHNLKKAVRIIPDQAIVPL